MIAFRARLAPAALAVLAACTRAGNGATATDGTGGPAAHRTRLVIATSADPKNLNPAFNSATPTLSLSSYLFSYTVRYDNRGRPVPDAVERLPTVQNGDVARDGLTIRYHLRRNMRWHDGQPVTCRDLRMTWQVMVNPKNIIDTTEGWRDIRDVDCRDPYVAVVRMKRVYAPFLQQLWSVNGNGPILPEHLLATLNDDKGTLNTAAYNSAPVGSGPYKFVAWERGSEVRLAANPDFYLGKPAIDEVVYRIIPDTNTLVTQVRTHEIDVAWNLPASSWGQLQGVPGDRIIAPIDYTFDHIDFNLRQPILADVRVRRALTYALDRPALLDKVQHGLGELADTFFDRTLYGPAVDPNVMKYPYDAPQARRLLDEAGWHAGADGIRTKGGTRLAFQVSSTTESAVAHTIESQAQAYWRAVGADVEVKNYPTSMFFDQTLNGILASGKFDAAVYAWSGAPDVDNSAIYSGHNLPPHGQNYPYWQNQTATRAMDDANGTIDQARRVADYRVVQREFAKDDPSVILWFRKGVIAYKDALQGFTPTPVILVFWDPWHYHL
ncbi:MAG: peptide ABC transporter substrate-binding protein [Candidatus Eremiobacteraeota bacterium]|nr:peptide ABC transporter substrate-binding protein [Candidatus Eremiobacteraeota bacterium]